VPGGKNIFALPPTKTAEFEVKNRHEGAEKNITKTFRVHVISVIFQNKVRSILETHSTKTTAVSESNNAEVLGRSPQPPNAGSGQSSLRCACGDFTAFLFKNTHF